MLVAVWLESPAAAEEEARPNITSKPRLSLPSRLPSGPIVCIDVMRTPIIPNPFGAGGMTDTWCTCRSRKAWRATTKRRGGLAETGKRRSALCSFAGEGMHAFMHDSSCLLVFFEAVACILCVSAKKYCTVILLFLRFEQHHMGVNRGHVSHSSNSQGTGIPVLLYVDIGSPGLLHYRYDKFTTSTRTPPPP